jgi:hypothetical protein
MENKHGVGVNVASGSPTGRFSHESKQETMVRWSQGEEWTGAAG